ncbi:hypothetical protein B0T10DRAFT_439881 [Thelonectria olida]|uniref:Uncharacterized protein n=1 Tax=Thelonectria olida TaxID=1576542 RepID=A0A9P8W9D1_9HYPO|nr:hypothetical protein B0T10DRAFT_439881 [Thelonectria olida]
METTEKDRSDSKLGWKGAASVSMLYSTHSTDAGASQGSECSEDSIDNTQFSTSFGETRSGGTGPSTVPVSHSRGKVPVLPGAFTIEETVQSATEELPQATFGDIDNLDDLDSLADDEVEQHCASEDFDADTTYSNDTIFDDPKLEYLQVFARKLAKDIKQDSGGMCIENMTSESLGPMLREFAWKLYGESLDPFQWEASVIINRKRRNIVQLLVPDAMGTETDKSASSEDGEDDGLSSRVPFKKSRDMVLEWAGTSRHGPEGPTEVLQLPQYEKFIQESEAYRWLLAEISQHGRLNFEGSSAMLEIGTKIRNHLQAQEPLRKMSSQRPPSSVRMTFHIDWNPVRFMHDEGVTPPFAEALPKIHCLTGSWNEAQATTAIDYMDQTWPQSGRALFGLVQKLLSVPVGEECSAQVPERRTRQNQSSLGTSRPKSNAAMLTARIISQSSCFISATGGHYFVSEIGEQVAWLAAALRPSPRSRGVAACTPRIKYLQATTHGEEIIGFCSLVFDFKDVEKRNLIPGFCWDSLFCSPILVCGYPILQRSEPKTGLEMSLGNIAAIIGSHQVVQWDERVLIKGFSMLMVATLVAADIIVWHLLVSENPGERISYIDSRLDELVETSERISLRMLEGRRHVVGWCSEATDWCGNAVSKHNVESSGLRKPPASIVIDKLYLEAGTDVVGGVSMSINKKEAPFWLQRENDYPSLLKWVAIQPIVFYNAADCRAWLIDGASALLHLVRISLYLDENDPKSTYNWVFDAARLEDKWDGLNGRQAALKTLKSAANRKLNVYVLGDGVSGPEYSTLENRIKRIIHSIEILIDRQVKVASQDGIRISQTLDPRREIVGFDILDVITPLGPIHPRIKHLNSMGHGWVDLIPSIGITTIFGRGFGELIRPDRPETVCTTWQSVPKGMDYMAASVSTLKMLYQKRLQRIEPGISGGEMTSKIVWTSPNHPFKLCGCFQKQGSGSNNSLENPECHSPLQFLAQKSWSHWERFVLRGAKPVHLAALAEKGAVVFGHIPLRGVENKGSPTHEQHNADGGTSKSSAEEALRPPISTSTTSRSTGSAGLTGITVPSSGGSSTGEGQDMDGSQDNGVETGKKKTRWWDLWKSR